MTGRKRMMAFRELGEFLFILVILGIQAQVSAKAISTTNIINCTFEDDLCSWSNEKSKNNTLQWIRLEGGDVARFPPKDHNMNSVGKFMATNSRKTGGRARLIISLVKGRSFPACFGLWVFDSSSGKNKLRVLIQNEDGMAVYKSGNLLNATRTNSTNNAWNLQEISLTGNHTRSRGYLIIEATVRNSSVIAIDDVYYYPGKCVNQTSSAYSSKSNGSVEQDHTSTFASPEETFTVTSASTSEGFSPPGEISTIQDSGSSTLQDGTSTLTTKSPTTDGFEEANQTETFITNPENLTVSSTISDTTTNSSESCPNCSISTASGLNSSTESTSPPTTTEDIGTCSTKAQIQSKVENSALNQVAYWITGTVVVVLIIFGALGITIRCKQKRDDELLMSRINCTYEPDQSDPASYPVGDLTEDVTFNYDEYSNYDPKGRYMKLRSESAN